MRTTIVYLIKRKDGKWLSLDGWSKKKSKATHFPTQERAENNSMYKTDKIIPLEVQY